MAQIVCPAQRGVLNYSTRGPASRRRKPKAFDVLFGPIFTAEMVTTARRTRYFVIRVVYAVVLLLTLWAIHDDNIHGARFATGQQLASLSADFFNTFAGLQLGIVTLLAPGLAATAIAIERERRTIEYLFATDLRDGEIVLAKLTARLLGVLCQVLVGLPILALAMLLGGISPQLLLLVYIVTLSTMFSFSAFGLAVSVTDTRATR